MALEAVIQVLSLIGPEAAEWKRTKFSREYELLERVVDRLNQISSRMAQMAESAQDVDDERYELSYRDYFFSDSSASRPAR